MIGIIKIADFELDFPVVIEVQRILQHVDQGIARLVEVTEFTRELCVVEFRDE